MGLVHSFCRFLSSQLRLVWPKSLPPSPSAEPRKPREPVTALGLFNQQMVLYTYADGEVVGIDSSTRQVLFRDCLPRESWAAGEIPGQLFRTPNENRPASSQNFREHLTPRNVNLH